MAHACDHDHNHAAGLAGPALDHQLAAAETRLAGRDQRLTAPRRRVLQMLLESGQPMKAYDLMAAYEPGAPAKPPTVYRALDFLERQGFAHRIESLNAFVACRHPLGAASDAPHAAAFLICDCCGATREVEPRLGSAISDQADEAGYGLTSLTIEGHGLCADCRAA